jgi:S1-C subfamily serine protease
MNGSRRAMLMAFSGAGLLLAAAPALAAEDFDPPHVPPRGWSGLTVILVGKEARIAQLEPLGPAARAGLRPGDVLLGANGGGVDYIPGALSARPGEQVELMVRRGTSRRTVRLVLEEPESARP